MQIFGALAGLSSIYADDDGYLFIAFKPELIGPADLFNQRVTELVERVKATPRRAGVDEIRIPSERAFRTRERLLREGLQFDRLVYDALLKLRRRGN
jgi:LDH2 family malate/lactate/ureidoglycolate dehydrogenase